MEHVRAKALSARAAAPLVAAMNTNEKNGVLEAMADAESPLDVEALVNEAVENTATEIV